jgi:hypothetical protein
MIGLLAELAELSNEDSTAVLGLEFLLAVAGFSLGVFAGSNFDANFSAIFTIELG